MGIVSSFDWNAVEKRIVELNDALEVIKNDLRKTGQMRKEVSYLEDICRMKQELNSSYDAKLEVEKILEFLDDKEMIDLCFIEKQQIESQIINLEAEFEEQICEVDERNSRSAFVEIRAGTGGQEASLFVADLARMYTMFGQKKHWNVVVSDASYTDVGGFREIILHIEGKNVFRYFHFESGVHRVQRVPTTENAGRVHTSTVTVAVLPEVEAVEVVIDDKDLRIDTYRAGGAGGQHVNKTDSAVRITHLPTNIVVQCQDERSQHKNKARAMKALQSKLFALEQEKQNESIAKTRKDMVSNADRSEKIRTYNYPQNRITDHRFNITLNQLDFIMNGDMDGLLNHILEQNKNNKRINAYLVNFKKKINE